MLMLLLNFKASASENQHSATSSSLSELQRKLEKIKNERLCVVCLSEESNMVFIPCGHVCTCESCSSNLRNSCPVCRKSFTHSQRVYV